MGRKGDGISRQQGLAFIQETLFIVTCERSQVIVIDLGAHQEWTLSIVLKGKLLFGRIQKKGMCIPRRMVEGSGPCSLTIHRPYRRLHLPRVLQKWKLLTRASSKQ